MLDVACCRLLTLAAFTLYGAVVVHKVRITSLRYVKKAKKALLDEETQLVWSLLEDMELLYTTPTPGV